MTPTVPSSAPSTRRFTLPLLLAYPVLAIATAVTHRQLFALLALALLLSVLLLPSLLRRRPLAWLTWVSLLGIVALSGIYGYAALLLEAVPLLINAMLAWWFGRTLATAEPLIARFIVAIEGVQRLRQPGVARYARQLTAFWTVLLSVQALLLAILLLWAAQSGVLARLHVAMSWSVPERWAAGWLHLGCYVLLGVAFVLEYGYRRWHLRHLEHSSLRQMVSQVAVQWPQLLRDPPALPR